MSGNINSQIAKQHRNNGFVCFLAFERYVLFILFVYLFICTGVLSALAHSGAGSPRMRRMKCPMVSHEAEHWNLGLASILKG